LIGRRLVPLPISGGSDDPGLLTALLADGAALCVECLARKTGIPLAEIAPILVRVGKTLRVQTAEARCGGCLSVRTVYRLA
jgi:hypothetical protein